MLFGIISTKDEIGQQLQQVINLYRVGKELEAEVILSQLKDSDGGNQQVWLTMAILSLEKCDLIKALEQANMALNLNNKSWQAQLLIGEVYQQFNKIEDAIPHYHKALKYSNNQCHEAHIKLARYYQDKQDDISSYEHFKMAIKLKPEDIESAISYAQIAIHNQEFEKAYGIIDAIYNYYPYNYDVLVIYGRLMIELEMYEEAEQLMNHMSLFFPTKWEIKYFLAEALYFQQQYDTALNLYEMALVNTSMDNAQLLSSYMNCLEAIGDHESATKVKAMLASGVYN